MEAECKLTSVNFRSQSDPGRAFQPAFRVTWISDDLVWEHNGSCCDKFESTPERRREIWKHHWRCCDMFGSMSKCWRELIERLGLSPNQCGNPKHTVRDAWVLMDFHVEDSGHYQRLSGYSRAQDYPPQ